MAERVSFRGARRGTRPESIAAAKRHSKRANLSARCVTPGASQRFVAATERLDSGTPVVSVIGEVDIATAPAFEQTLLGVAENLTGEAIVDLSGCSFLDTKGLKALIATKARLEPPNRPLAVVLSNPSVLRTFEITGFDELVEIYPSLGAAVGDGHG